MTLELNNRGHVINHKRVKRLMSVLRLYAKLPKAKYRSYRGEVGKKAPNLFMKDGSSTRDFSTSGLNQKWTTDVSEFHIAAGKLYLSPIMDIHNREIISYVISKRPNYIQIKTMLDRAFSRNDNLTNLIFHSDQGWQYQMKHYQEELKKQNIRQSMSRKGNCLDNSPMENFFGIMKNEMFYGHEYEFETLAQLERAMNEYIKYYNEHRITIKLKGLSPLKYRVQSLSNKY